MTTRKVKEAWIVSQLNQATKEPMYLKRQREYLRWEFRSQWAYVWTERQDEARRYRTQSGAERAAEKEGGTARLIRWFEEEDTTN